MQIVNAVFSKQHGGLEQVSLDYTAALQAHGHHVTMLLNGRCPFIDDAAAAADAIHIQTNHFGRWDVWAQFQLRRWLQAIRPDVVIAHGSRAVQLLRPAAQGIAPFIAVNHSPRIRYSRKADAAICVNDEQMAQLLAKGKDPQTLFLLPNMVGFTPEHRALRVSFAPQTPPVIGVMARLEPAKGVDVFLQALALLKNRGVVVRARIGGNGTQRAMLRKQADTLGLGNRVEFLGWVKDRDSFYGALDVFCMPSRKESFGRAVLEAFQHKLPVIATNCHGVRQLSDGRNVTLMVPVDDPTALADAMMRLVKDWPLAQRLASAGYALVEEKYDIQIVAGQLQNIIEQVVARYAAATHITKGADA